MNALRRKWNSTIRVRLTVLYGGAFFLAGLTLIAIMYFQLNQVVGQQLIFRSVVMSGPGGTGPPDAAKFTLKLNPDGPVTAAEPGPKEKVTIPFEPGQRELAAAQAQLRTARTETMRMVLVVSSLSLVAVGLGAGLLGWLLAGQALQPLRQITTTVRGIADRNLHQRIAMQGPQDEIKDLADTLDDMLGRLDRTFDSQQRFIANASHELRTPLAINRTLIEVAMLKDEKLGLAFSQLGATLLSVNQRHEHLIDGLLMLATSEQEIANPGVVDLAEIARHVLTESAVMARTAGVELRSQFDAAICLGDAVLLERLAQNLVDNAIRYNLPADGWLNIATAATAQGEATVLVENSGPLIPSYEVPRLFEPFRRLSSTERLAEGSGSLSRRGAGLGLSIVHAIVTSHRGSVQATSLPEGGLSIRIVLPAHKP